MDDTFIIIQRSQKDNFLQHLNAIGDNIHFTCEEAGEDGSISFLDMLITPDEDGRLSTTVYRKATHMDQYLHWNGHHAIASDYSVVGTQFHRARTVCSSPGQLQREKKFVPIPKKMQISRLGHKQSEVEEPVLSPKKKVRRQQQP